MLRTFGNLTLVWCLACSVVSAAEARRTTREDPGERARRSDRPVAETAETRLVTIEVLIADVHRGEAAKGDVGELPGDPKARIEQLDKAGKLDSLTRIQLTTVDREKASLQVGQRVARITASTRMAGGFGGAGGVGGGGGRGGQVNSFTMDNVGLRVAVTPQVRRDGLVVMAIDIERSQLGPADEGPVISQPADGEAIRVAPVESLTSQSTVSAHSGQSVLVGAEQTRRQSRQSELMIVVTPQFSGSEPPPSAR